VPNATWGKRSETGLRPFRPWKISYRVSSQPWFPGSSLFFDRGRNCGAKDIFE